MEGLSCSVRKMAPKRSPRRRASRSRYDTVRFQLYFNCKEGQEAVTTVGSISETFDRKRPFRVSHVSGKLASYGLHPVNVQLEANGPVSSADNTWVSPSFLVVPNGTSFRYVIPPTVTGWFPSDSATDTQLLNLKALCISPADAGVIGNLTVTVMMGAREWEAKCLTMEVRSAATSDPRLAPDL